MPTASSNDIQLHYESFGARNAPAVLLIMGLGAQLVRWNLELCDELVSRGFRVIRFDNRDCGLSTRCDRLAIPDFKSFWTKGSFSVLPYTLDTMAVDSVGLLDALDIDKAHVVGASMGGAIAQIIAARYPQRTLSLTAIMASSGNPQLPPPSPAAAAALFSPQPKAFDRASIVADAIVRHRAIGSPAYPIAEADLEKLYGAEYDRGFYPQGVARQLAAIMAHGDRRHLLKAVNCPTTVLHGKDDPLIPYACGEDIARNVPNARMLGVEGMGHDFPVALTRIFADAIELSARG